MNALIQSVTDRYLSKTAADSIAIYKGRKYKLLWGPGKTKFGEKCKLGFFDGTKEFWADAKDVQIQQSSGSRRNSPSYGRWMCPRCGEENDAQQNSCWECGARRPYRGR